MYEVFQKANEIARNLGQVDIRNYALRNPQKLSSDMLKLVLDQYQFLRKMHEKVPVWAENTLLLGASSVNIEQSTSQEVAEWKFNNLALKKTADLTGGFGVDSFFLSSHSLEHTYCEINTTLFKTVIFNFEKLGKSNVNFKNCGAEIFIQSSHEYFDLIYLDPDRRNSENSRMVRIEDCSPSLPQIQSRLLEISEEVWVKYSPLLDISRALTQLQNVFEVVIIAVKNEVKELIFKMNLKKKVSQPIIRAVNLLPDARIQEFTFQPGDEKEARATFGIPEGYLYEPNAAILKSGAFQLVATRYALKKLAPSSHFYSSEKLVDDFPGKIFRIHHMMSPTPKNMKTLAGTGWNIISRNI